jgi:hypothetical protein
MDSEPNINIIVITAYLYTLGIKLKCEGPYPNPQQLFMPLMLCLLLHFAICSYGQIYGD